MAIRRLKSAGAAALALALVCLSGYARAQDADQGHFMPHGYCYLWDSRIVLLHVLSDGLIALSYFCIPIALVYLVRKRDDLPFNWILWMFSGFIVSCGLTHLMEVWTIWHATYLLAGVLKAATAGLSMITAVMLIPLVQKAAALPSATHLAHVSQDLQLSTVAREMSEQQLRHTLRDREMALSHLAERQNAVNELRKVQATLREQVALLDLAPVAIISRDMNNKVRFWSHGAEDLYGIPRAQALGNEALSFARNGSPVPLSELAQEIEKIDLQATERTLSAPTGTAKVIGSRWALRRDEAGKPIGYLEISGDMTDRKRAEAARERLAAIVDSTNDAIISKTLDGTITAWNPSAERLFGYSASEAIGQPTLMLFPPEQVGEERDLLARIARGESVQHYETIRVRKNGSRFHVSVTISPIRDRDGRIVGASKIVRDITEQLAAQRALREAEECFQAMANGIQQLAWMAGPDGSIFWYNQRWYEYTGTAFEQMQGWGWQSVHDPDFLPQVMVRWKTALAAGEPFDMEFPLRRADGKFRMFLTRCMPVRSAADGQVRWFGTNTDISERKEAEEQLERQAQELAHSREALETQALMLQSVLDSMDEGLVVADERGTFTIWNATAERMIGLGPTELPIEQWSEHYGTFLSDGVTPFPSEQLPLVRAMRGEACNVEIFLRNKKTSAPVWIEASGSPLRSKQGRLRGGVLAMRDITRRKADEREICKLNEGLELRIAELARSNRELEQFAYVASHDLQEPLRMVASYTQLLAERYRGKLDESADKFINYASEGALRMQVLIQDLLAFSRIGRTGDEREMLDCNRVLQDVTLSLAAAIQESGAIVTAHDLPTVWADRLQMTQLFQNLIGNAIKFRRNVPPEIVLRAEPSASSWQITVTDNGIGIAPEYAENIFVVFQRLHARTEYPGNGIGLAICKKIVEHYGGKIWVEGRPGLGSTFHFTIPIAVPHSSQLEQLEGALR